MYNKLIRPENELNPCLTFRSLKILVMVISLFLSTPPGVFAKGLNDGLNDFEYYYKTGDWVKVVAAFNTELRENPQEYDINKVAEAYFYLGRFDSAEEAAKKALKTSDNPDSRIILALIRAKRGEADKAMKDLEALRKDNNNDHKIFTAMGIINTEDDITAALSYFNKAVEKNPDDFLAWFNIGLIYENDEVFEEAGRAYKNAVRINPLFAQAQNNLGYTYKERHFYAYAVEHYQRAIELRPDNAGYYYNIGNAYTHQERIEDAFNAYKKALEIDPAFAKAHYNMGRTYLRKDMVKEAMKEFRLYLKYGNKAVFRFVAPKDMVEEELEQLETYLVQSPPVKPAARDFAR